MAYCRTNMLSGIIDFLVLLIVIMVLMIHGCSAQTGRWPGGTYGLPKPHTGCPTGWGQGDRYHDTEDNNPNNLWSDPLDLDGTWTKSNMRYGFCMKTQTSGDELAWPAGSYCIYKKGVCPSGFESGSIRWDDEDSANANTECGTLPDGTYDGNTIMEFCCRNDAATTLAISLPRVDEFMLLSRDDSCQQVLGMTVTKEWFRWDNEDSNNGDRGSGVYPYEGVQSGGENVKLNFCFYETNSGSSWPAGTYGLPKPLSGCPGGWEDGERYHDTEDSNNGNQWSDPLHLDGTQNGYGIRHKFCMKTEGITGLSLPKGNYCIYRYGGACPSGFVEDQNTFIYWDDENSQNANAEGGTLPDGTYDRNTRIQFCCRSDGETSERISLPTVDDFYLFSITDTCQEVFGMSVTEEWVRWDNQDGNNGDFESGVHPYEGVQSSGENVKLNFCYYERQ